MSLLQNTNYFVMYKKYMIYIDYIILSNRVLLGFKAEKDE